MSTDLSRIFYITFWILIKSYFDCPLTKIVCSIDSGLFFETGLSLFWAFSDFLKWSTKNAFEGGQTIICQFDQKTDWQTDGKTKRKNETKTEDRKIERRKIKTKYLKERNQKQSIRTRIGEREEKKERKKDEIVVFKKSCRFSGF